MVVLCNMYSDCCRMVELYPRAVASDDELPNETSSDEEEDQALSVRKKRKVAGGSNIFAADFLFDEGSATGIDKETRALQKYLKKSVKSTLEEKIAAMRQKKNSAEAVEVEDMETDEQPAPKKSKKSSDDDDVEQLGVDASDSLKEKKKQMGKKKSGKDEEAFFSENITHDDGDDGLTFEQMNLSRPILKAIGATGYTEPTPIQASTIPVALAGRDICACAATGTGKTAAFVLPIIERLLYRPKQRSVTRVLVLVPTRELAIQVFQVFNKLSQFVQLDVCLCAGGMDLKAQEAALRAGPDVVVATPGRLIDHLSNAPSFTLSTIEVLVLDEADRMLDEAFAEQMNEIIKQCAASRQTLLFSATMTDKVDELATMSLRKPVRIFMNENTETASRLRQEFVRIRVNRDGDREAIVAALVTRTFQESTIVFVRTKRDCQRLQIVLGLLGVKVGQMHSNLSQTMRIEALAKFKRREIDVLVSTDLASRGLDIDGVQTVINMNMPPTLKTYIHRIGRTARAGKAGRAISLVGEDDRKLLKDIVNTNPDRTLKQRVVAPEVIEAYSQRVESLEESIKEIEEEEKADRAMRIAEAEMKKTEEKLETGTHEREGRKWIGDEDKKKETPLDKMAKRKLKMKQKREEAKKAPKTDEEKTAERIADFQAREAKRGRRNQRLRVFNEDSVDARRANEAAKGKTGKGKKSSFTAALAGISQSQVKKARHGPDDLDFKKKKVGHKKRTAAAKGKGKFGNGNKFAGKGKK